MSFNEITHRLTNQKLSIFSTAGKNLLKNYVKMYKSGGSRENWVKFRNFLYDNGLTLTNAEEKAREGLIKILKIKDNEDDGNFKIKLSNYIKKWRSETTNNDYKDDYKDNYNLMIKIINNNKNVLVNNDWWNYILKLLD